MNGNEMLYMMGNVQHLVEKRKGKGTSLPEAGMSSTTGHKRKRKDTNGPPFHQLLLAKYHLREALMTENKRSLNLMFCIFPMTWYYTGQFFKQIFIRN